MDLGRTEAMLGEQERRMEQSKQVVACVNPDDYPPPVPFEASNFKNPDVVKECEETLVRELVLVQGDWWNWSENVPESEKKKLYPCRIISFHLRHKDPRNGKKSIEHMAVKMQRTEMDPGTDELDEPFWMEYPKDLRKHWYNGPEGKERLKAVRKRKEDADAAAEAEAKAREQEMAALAAAAKKEEAAREETRDRILNQVIQFTRDNGRGGQSANPVGRALEQVLNNFDNKTEMLKHPNSIDAKLIVHPKCLVRITKSLKQKLREKHTLVDTIRKDVEELGGGYWGLGISMRIEPKPIRTGGNCKVLIDTVVFTQDSDICTYDTLSVVRKDLPASENEKKHPILDNDLDKDLKMLLDKTRKIRDSVGKEEFRKMKEKDFEAQLELLIKEEIAHSKCQLRRQKSMRLFAYFPCNGEMKQEDVGEYIADLIILGKNYVIELKKDNKEADMMQHLPTVEGMVRCMNKNGVSWEDDSPYNPYFGASADLAANQRFCGIIMDVRSSEFGDATVTFFVPGYHEKPKVFCLDGKIHQQVAGSREEEGLSQSAGKNPGLCSASHNELDPQSQTERCSSTYASDDDVQIVENLSEESKHNEVTVGGRKRKRCQWSSQDEQLLIHGYNYYKLSTQSWLKTDLNKIRADSPLLKKFSEDQMREKIKSLEKVIGKGDSFEGKPLVDYYHIERYEDDEGKLRDKIPNWDKLEKVKKLCAAPNRRCKTAGRSAPAPYHNLTINLCGEGTVDEVATEGQPEKPSGCDGDWWGSTLRTFDDVEG